MTDYISDIKDIINNLEEDIEYDNFMTVSNYIYENLIFIHPEFDKEIFKKTIKKY